MVGIVEYMISSLPLRVLIHCRVRLKPPDPDRRRFPEWVQSWLVSLAFGRRGLVEFLHNYYIITWPWGLGWLRFPAPDLFRRLGAAILALDSVLEALLQGTHS